MSFSCLKTILLLASPCRRYCHGKRETWLSFVTDFKIRKTLVMGTMGAYGSWMCGRLMVATPGLRRLLV